MPTTLGRNHDEAASGTNPRRANTNPKRALSDASRMLANWPLIVVGALLVLVNYAALAIAYRTGALSLVYPISRGATSSVGVVVAPRGRSLPPWAAARC